MGRLTEMEWLRSGLEEGHVPPMPHAKRASKG
jgi:hypothetical protein